MSKRLTVCASSTRRRTYSRACPSGVFPEGHGRKAVSRFDSVSGSLVPPLGNQR